MNADYRHSTPYSYTNNHSRSTSEVPIVRSPLHLNTIVPIGDRISEEEHGMIDEQFRNLDQHNNGEISREGFCRNLALIGSFPQKSQSISSLLFDVFDANRSARVEQSDFKNGIGILTHGTKEEQVNCKSNIDYSNSIVAMKIFDPTMKGHITRQEFINTICMAYQILERMEVPVPDDYVKSAEALFNSFKFPNQTITKNDFQHLVKPCIGFNALGLLSELGRSNPTITLERTGTPVSFGHSSFYKVLALMVGIRTSVSTFFKN
jgi:Ca2+-binding EF-hand superfamily protein